MDQWQEDPRERINSQLETVRKQLGGLERIERLLDDTNTILRDIRTDVRELAASNRES